MISSCNKIQLDDLPCHFKNGMEQSAIYRCASKVIYSFAQRVLRTRECIILPSVGDLNIHLCFTFRIGWQAVYLNTHFSSSFTSMLSQARFSRTGITYSLLHF